MKITEIKEETLYFGKNKKELLKKYRNIYGIRKFFGKDVLKVQLQNKDEAYIDKNFNIVCEYAAIYGMEKFFDKDVLYVELDSSNWRYIDYAYIDENFEVICKYRGIYGMKKFFGKDVLEVNLKSSFNAYVDKNLNILLEFDEIEEMDDYYIIEINDKKYKVEK
ncbi:MAG TPA: hypothetical protein ENH46_06895 [Candidatus Pacearchaeota archaeon]|nr:hypothetical protein [Candidatus Pacearchaeota archaeon]